MSMPALKRFLACSCFFVAANVQSVAAADVSPLTPDVQTVETGSGWSFSFAPYFWGAGLSGELAQFGLPTVDVHAKFGDIFDHLDFGAMAMAEARRERFSMFGDVMYSKVSGQAGTPRGLLADSVEVSSETFAGLIGGGYAVFQNDVGHLDLVGGVKVWSVDSDLRFSGGPLDGLSTSDAATWVDAVAGVRGMVSLTSKVYLTGWGLIGAGGADLDWDVAAGLGYRFTDRYSAVVGYRALGVNYENDGFIFDVVEQGPVLGVVVRF